jgi:hypothetical protein
VGAIELKDASVSILTVLHLVKAHISMSTLITPELIFSSVDFGMIFEAAF